MGGDRFAAKRVCKIVGCERPIAGHGLCKYHHQRWRRHGDPLEPIRRVRFTDAELTEIRHLMRTGPFRRDSSLAQGLATDLAFKLGRSPESMRQTMAMLRRIDRGEPAHWWQRDPDQHRKRRQIRARED